MDLIELLDEIIEATGDCDTVEEVQDFLLELKDELEVNLEVSSRDDYTPEN